jgi:hypothetical protein
MISNYPTTYDIENNVNNTKTFNISDFTANKKSATVADLKYYAHKNKQNLFTEVNYFNGIYVTSINSVTDDILNFLSTIGENVQDAIVTLRSNVLEILRKTTNLDYNDEDDLTYFTSNVKMERLTIQDNINANSLTLISNLNVPNINNNSILSKQITTQELNCQSIRCNKMVSSNDVSAYIYYNNRTIPMQRSNALINILPDAMSPFLCTCTIKQGYRLEFLDAYNKRLFNVRNDYQQSKDFLYNVNVQLNEKPYKVLIYYENVLLS